MILAKRFKVDIRGPDMNDNDAENLITDVLVKLQLNEKNERNDVKIVDIKEVGKSSGDFVVLIIYEDKGLDTKSKKE